jgi:Modifier of rudimentary (Mod(r)) protein
MSFQSNLVYTLDIDPSRKQDLADLLSKAELLSALAHSHSTTHPSTTISQEPLQAALTENISLASHLNELEARLLHLRASIQTQLLSTHALERQWRQKQSDMDRALSPFSPSSLYQRLCQGVQEQEMVCRALEESFVEEDSGQATEREITEWVRRYRDAKKLYYSRRERKERWDEGRVGGWR